MSADVAALLARLKRAAQRLEVHASYPVPAGTTDPDPDGVERWEAGQVWAHLAEFPAYWLDQARGVLASGGSAPVPFGRTKTDPARLLAIERERRTAPIELFERARAGIDDAAEVLRALPDTAWGRLGEHPTLGPMSVEQIMERFLVSHLEEHADQLDLLAERAASQPAAAVGLLGRRSWPVWANHVEHRVDVELNVLTGSLRVDVDGRESVKRSGWKMGLNATEVPFDVDGRPCLLIVRTKYGAQPEIDLYSEGRSLSTGEALEKRRATASRELPNLVRMLILFIPLIGGFNTVLLRSETVTRAFGGWGSAVLIGIGVVLAAVAWWVSSRWYARAPDAAHRHLVGGAIVAAAWAVFFVALVSITIASRV